MFCKMLGWGRWGKMCSFSEKDLVARHFMKRYLNLFSMILYKQKSKCGEFYEYDLFLETHVECDQLTQLAG